MSIIIVIKYLAVIKYLDNDFSPTIWFNYSAEAIIISL